MKYFPFVHLLALIVGTITLFILKRKYKKIRFIELITIFILFLILVTLFTEPALNLARKLISFIQIQ